MTTNDHSLERDLLIDASNRLLSRTSESKQPTAVELAYAAGLPRWKLTHRHRDLNDAFQAAARKKWGADAPTATADRARLAVMQDKFNRAQARITELEGLVDTYAIVVEEMRLQNEELRGERRGNVTQIRPV